MGMILKNCKQLLTVAEDSKDQIGLNVNTSVLIEDERIVEIGEYEVLRGKTDDSVIVLDCSEKIVLPGFVDSHTHLVFGASRMEEYVARLTVKSTEEVKKLVGKIGLESSISSTKEAGYEGLMSSSMNKLENLLKQGITTVEIKSGYGIDKDTELEQLRVVRDLKEKVWQSLHPTYLGAHYWDVEMGKAAYIAYMIEEVMPRIKEEELAEFCDVWCDDGYYTAEESRIILEAARAYGMKPKIHTDCYSYIGGSKMAAEIHAVSVDHLNYLPDQIIPELRDAGVVGVLLPGTDFSVAHPKPFKARPMLDSGMTVALATNLNPGNWMESMQMVIALACRNHCMTPEEAIRASTLNGAKALQLQDELGSIEPGKYADIQIWNAGDYREVCYKLGGNLVETVIVHGRIAVSDGAIAAK